MRPVTESVATLDLHYLGQPQLIACGVVQAPEGLVLIDPGPATATARLLAGLHAAGHRLGDVRAVLLTHIHLDHAGGVGALMDACPNLEVYVHRLGAPHLIDPQRLLRSAQRLYGADMDLLWGTVRPVPEAHVHIVRGGETLSVAGRSFQVAYTPGHAIHHVSYLDVASGTAFVGDTAGMAVAGADYVVPVTPPPDVHVERWLESLDVIAAWAPARLFVTHFGPSERVDWHLDEMRTALPAWTAHVRETLKADGPDAEKAAAFEVRTFQAFDRAVAPAYRTAYRQFALPTSTWYGLARYLRKHAERAK
ncbi:MAG: MBL fold metallo-hydrolase [Bacteroidota bacterium]